MIDARWARRLGPATAIALLAFAAAPEARADCTANVAGDHVFALAGGLLLRLGTYDPTTAISTPPVNIVGLFAQNGGVIVADIEIIGEVAAADAESAFITVNANPAAGSYGIWSEGVGESEGDALFPSQIDLEAPVAVTTSGTGSIGLYASEGGTIDTPDGLSVTVNGASSVGVRASGASSTITVAGVAIVVNGPSSNGVQADAGGAVIVNGGTVTLAPTVSDAVGLFATGSGSRITADDTVIVTDGPRAFGVLSESGGEVDLVGGSVTTRGAGSSGAVALFGSFSANGTSITTEGGVDLAGVEAAGVSIDGAGATGVLINDTIMTSGVESDGVVAQTGGAVALSGVNENHHDRGQFDRAPRDGRRRHQRPGRDHDLNRLDPGLDRAQRLRRQRRRSGIANQPRRDDGHDCRRQRLWILRQRRRLDRCAGRTGLSPTSGESAIGLYASGSGSTIVAGGASIATHGNSATGVRADGGGVVTVNGSVTTSGADAPGAAASGAGSIVTLDGATTLRTVGDGSIGLHALGGGLISALGQTTISTGSTVAATGLDAYGVNAEGAGSQVNLAGATITTTGERAAGLYASDDASEAVAAGHGGAIAVSGPLGVVTGGSSAYGAWAHGAGSTIALNGRSAFAQSSAPPSRFSPIRAAPRPPAPGSRHQRRRGGRCRGQWRGSSATLRGATTVAPTAIGRPAFSRRRAGQHRTSGSRSLAVSGAGSIGVQALSGAVSASGALNVTTSQASSRLSRSAGLRHRSSLPAEGQSPPRASRSPS